MIKRIKVGDELDLSDDIALDYYLSLGGGTQSSALFILEGNRMRHRGDGMRRLAIYADTGSEPSRVMDRVETLASLYSDVWQVVVVSRTHGVESQEYDVDGPYKTIPFFTLNDKGHKGRCARQCTSYYKILPIKDVILSALLARGLAKRAKPTKNTPLGARRVKSGVKVRCWLGFSLDEVTRMRRPRKVSSWEMIEYPLIEKYGYTKDDCIQIVKDAGLEGSSLSSSCCVCPYTATKEFLDTLSSEERERVAKFDDKIRNDRRKKNKKGSVAFFLTSSLTPIRELLSEDSQNEEVLSCTEGCWL